MDPLLRHLGNRQLSMAALKFRLLDAAESLPASLRRGLDKTVWPFAWSHMRAMARGTRFRIMGDGTWEIGRSGFLVRSKTFAGLVGKISRPVSIVASGPSARDHPWENLRDGRRFVIAVNGAPSLLSESGIRPDLLVVTDSEFISSGCHHLARAAGVPLVITCRAASRLASLAPGDLRQRDYGIIERVNAWYGVPAVPLTELADLNARSGSPFHLPAADPHQFKVGWSDSPDRGIFAGGTVVFAALQIAVGLGAADIEIIGMDLGGSSRAYAEEAGAPPSFLAAQYAGTIRPSFEIMNRALRGTRLKVHNRSPVCPLPPEIFEF